MEAKSSLFYYQSLTFCYKTTTTLDTEDWNILGMWRSVIGIGL